MSNDFSPNMAQDMALQRLSAALDGEVGASEATLSAQTWAVDPEHRTQWHAWCLAGDVMRADDLACNPAHDEAFLARLRERMAGEPVVLAPTVSRPLPAASGAARWAVRWASGRVAGSAAALAGVAVVAFVAVSVRNPPSEVGTTPLASVAPKVDDVGTPTSLGSRPSLALSSSQSVVVRDPRLDAYLAAHKQFSGSSALGVPSTFLRSATVELSDR